VPSAYDIESVHCDPSSIPRNNSDDQRRRITKARIFVHFAGTVNTERTEHGTAHVTSANASDIGKPS
jgi:hypothetical protein